MNKVEIKIMYICMYIKLQIENELLSFFYKLACTYNSIRHNRFSHIKRTMEKGKDN